MKDVGYTKEGNRLVEMNNSEYTHFTRLCMSVEGRETPVFFGSPNDYAFREGFDFSKTFEVIRAIYLDHFRINELQGLLNEIKRSLSD